MSSRYEKLTWLVQPAVASVVYVPLKRPWFGCCKRINVRDKPAIAPPVFVFQKLDRSLKRPAEDPLSSHANGVTACCEKRGRSSSFTFMPAASQSLVDASQVRVRSASFTAPPTFPPSQLASRNNIFMPSTLHQMTCENHSGIDKESTSVSQSWNVLRPAILQPPQVQTFTQSVMLDKVQEVQSSEKHCQTDSVSTLLPEEDFRSVENPTKLSTFLPLKESEPARSPLSQDNVLTDGGSPRFVFGENMSDRVVNPLLSSKCDAEGNEGEAAKDTDEFLAQSRPTVIESPRTKYGSVQPTTLMESAAAYTAASAPKCLPVVVPIITGEEGESNVLQISCKLFVHDKRTQSWTERGRGYLRLNDTASNEDGTLQSRLVMRQQGNLRLILNSRLWANMQIERANRKSLCCTATDLEDKSVQVFLIQASAKDIGRLYTAIHHRLVALRNCVTQESDSTQTEPDSEASMTYFKTDSEDEEDDELTQMGCTVSGRCGWIGGQSVLCT
ncbi:ran-binding protein 3-like isoform X2 [Protopterus annectens]|uniref:ran-binding protein 3-like isoform X2 n=1 Tax=Protopterus annectens TaxID=7888 RepID=UPI001CF98195|nr:ran-binding protein 3-like isoform X2 [Protopterus annectens]